MMKMRPIIWIGGYPLDVELEAELFQTAINHGAKFEFCVERRVSNFDALPAGSLFRVLLPYGETGQYRKVSPYEAELLDAGAIESILLDAGVTICPDGM